MEGHFRLCSNSARMYRGDSLLCTAIIIAMFAIMSLAVDYGAVELAKAQLQSTTDAAAPAVASGVPLSSAEARSRAKSIGASNQITDPKALPAALEKLTRRPMALRK